MAKGRSKSRRNAMRAERLALRRQLNQKEGTEHIFGPKVNVGLPAKIPVRDVPGLVLPDETVEMHLPGVGTDAKGLQSALESADPHSLSPALDVMNKIVQAHANIHGKRAARGKITRHTPGPEWVSIGRNKQAIDLIEEGTKNRHPIPERKAHMFVKKEDRARVLKLLEEGADLTKEGNIDITFVVEPDKRKPILFDLMIDSVRTGNLQTYQLDKDARAAFDSVTASAKKFVLDDDATRYLAEYERDHPEKIALANEYAIPPFKVMWLEYNNALAYRTVTGHDIADDGAQRKGFLFNNGHVMIFTDHPDGTISLSPLMLRLNKPATLEEELEVCRLVGASRIALDHFMWGQSTAFIQNYHPELLRTFRENHAVVPALTRFKGLEDGVLSPYFMEWAGDMRAMIAALVFLNRTQDVQVIEDLKAKPGLIQRKPRAYVGHSVITLKLNPMEKLKRVGPSGQSGPKRLHDVRGHYCRNKTAKHAEELGDTCQRLDMEDPLFYLTCHDWKEVVGSKHIDQKTGAIMTWKCSRCHGSLWRKPEFQRGRLGALWREFDCHGSCQFQEFRRAVRHVPGVSRCVHATRSDGDPVPHTAGCSFVASLRRCDRSSRTSRYCTGEVRLAAL